jgi:putative two-component system response regulator
LIYERSYKQAFPEDIALEIIKKGVGSHFDPEIYEVFMNLLPEFAEIQEQLQPG